MIDDDKERGSGRTKAMVMALPDDGKQVYVLVADAAMGRYVDAMIRGLRSSTLYDNTTIIASAHLDGISFIVGRNLRADRVFFDHSVDPFVKASAQAWLIPTL